jgi:hypothetical protein
MPVILDTRKAEIRRIVLSDQPEQIVLENIPWKYLTHTHTHTHTHTQAGGMAQVVQRLPSKCEALSSNSNTTETTTTRK